MKKMMKEKLSEKVQYFESLSNPIRYVPTAMFFTKGKGIHKDQLTSFELALRDGAGDRLRAAERERHHDAGEQHGIAGWQDDQGAAGDLGVRGGPTRRTRRSARLLIPSGLRGFGRLRRGVFSIGHLLHQT